MSSNKIQKYKLYYIRIVILNQYRLNLHKIYLSLLRHNKLTFVSQNLKSYLQIYKSIILFI